MKTSAVASLLFGTLAIAAPLEKRRYVTKTSVVVQTEIVYVTVYGDQAPVAEATSTPGLFYEQPPKKSSSSSAAAPTSTSTKKEEPAYTPPAPAPSSTTTAAPAPEPTSVYTPPPAPSTSAYVAPAPAPSSTTPEAPAPSATTPPSSGDGNEYEGEMTVYDTYGGYGACGTLLSDDEMTAAISKDSWGADVWGSADNINKNPWCGKSATVTYNGQSITVKILDKCQGCVPGDIDLTRAAWNKLTGNAYGSRVAATWTT